MAITFPLAKRSFKFAVANADTEGESFRIMQWNILADGK